MNGWFKYIQQGSIIVLTREQLFQNKIVTTRDLPIAIQIEHSDGGFYNNGQCGRLEKCTEHGIRINQPI